MGFNAKPMRLQDQRRAFTLVELLVVIAIMSLLLTLLMPGLREARKMARKTLCASNVRTLVFAATTYASENDGMFPPFSVGYNWTVSPRIAGNPATPLYRRRDNYTTNSPFSNPVQTSFDNVVNYTPFITTDESAGPGFVSRLYKYKDSRALNSPKFFYCPYDPDASNASYAKYYTTASNGYNGFSGYMWNFLVGGPKTDASNGYMVLRQSSDPFRMVWDQGTVTNYSTNWGNHRRESGTSNASKWFVEGQNMGYSDGHVQWNHYKDSDFREGY